MARNSYPTGADLAALLAASGITLDPSQVSSAVAAGIESFEHAAGRKMLAGKTTTNLPLAPQVRTYLPPENTFGILDLASDLAAEPTVVYQPQGGSAESLTVLTDYRLDPENGPQEGRPYERLQFQRRWYQPAPWSFGSSLQITGLWGYGTTLAEDVWRAMLHGGLLWLSGQAWAGTSGPDGSVPLKSWAEADVKEEYAVPDWMQRRAGLQAEIDGIVGRYRKVVL